MGDSPIKVDAIPGANLDPAAVKEAAGQMKSIGEAFAEQGGTVLTAWQKISGSYEAPEDDTLFSVMDPVKTNAETFGNNLVSVAGALTTYAGKAEGIKAKLDQVRTEAQTLVESIKGDDDWADDDDKRNKNNSLITQVNDQMVALWTAERECANAIYDLFHHPHIEAASEANPEGYGVTDIPDDAEMPWGSHVEEPENCIEATAGAVKGFVWDGLIVGGIWGTIKGLGTLVLGYNPETGEWFSGDAYAAAWSNLGMMGVGLLNTATLGLAGKLPGATGEFFRNGTDTLVTAGKGMIAWDKWSDDPAAAAGESVFNVGTFFIPVGGAVAGGTKTAANGAKAGKVATTIKTAAKVTDWIDPASLAVKGVTGTIKFAAPSLKAALGTLNLTKIGELAKMDLPKIDVPTSTPDDFSFHSSGIPDAEVPPVRAVDDGVPSSVPAQSVPEQVPVSTSGDPLTVPAPDAPSGVIGDNGVIGDSGVIGDAGPTAAHTSTDGLPPGSVTDSVPGSPAVVHPDGSVPPVIGAVDGVPGGAVDGVPGGAADGPPVGAADDGVPAGAVDGPLESPGIVDSDGAAPPVIGAAEDGVPAGAVDGPPAGAADDGVPAGAVDGPPESVKVVDSDGAAPPVIGAAEDGVPTGAADSPKFVDSDGAAPPVIGAAEDGVPAGAADHPPESPIVDSDGATRPVIGAEDVPPKAWDPEMGDPTLSDADYGPGFERHNGLRGNQVDPLYGLVRSEHGTLDPAFGPPPLDQLPPALRELVTDPDAPYGRGEDGHPYSKQEWESRYIGPDNRPIYPGDDGAVAGRRIDFDDIDAFRDHYGDVLDRMGGDGGDFMSFPETPFEHRALPPGNLRAQYSTLELTGKLPPGMKIEVSEIAPAFGQPGGGLQVRFLGLDGKAVSVAELVSQGVLRHDGAPLPPLKVPPPEPVIEPPTRKFSGYGGPLPPFPQLAEDGDLPGLQDDADPDYRWPEGIAATKPVVSQSGTVFQPYDIERVNSTLPDGSVNHDLNGDKIRPHTRYELDGGRFIFETDDQGRVVYAQGRLDHLEGTALSQLPDFGGVDQAPGESATYLFGPEFGAPETGINITLMDGQQADSWFPQGTDVYLELEQQWRNQVLQGKAVDVQVFVNYGSDPGRPEGFDVYQREGEGRFRKTATIDNLVGSPG